MLEFYCVSNQPIQAKPPSRLSCWSLRECTEEFDHALAVRCDVFAVQWDSPAAAQSLQMLRELRPETIRLVIADEWRPELLELSSLAHRFVRFSDTDWLQRVADSAYRARTLVQDPSLRTSLSLLPSLPCTAECGPWEPAVLSYFARFVSPLAGPESNAFGGDDDLNAGQHEQIQTLASGELRNINEIVQAGHRVSHACARIANEYHLDAATCTEFALAGKLHNIGQLALAATVDQYGEIRETAESIGQPLPTVEQHVLAADYLQVGGYLAQLWGFPTHISDAIEHHLEPRRSAAGREFSMAAAIYAALCASGWSDVDFGFLRDVGLQRAYEGLVEGVASFC